MNVPYKQLAFSIINTKMTVAAMRDSGYKSTTHALAEIIDNSIEANATAIEIFGLSRQDEQTGRITLTELAVLDNGVGMDATTLRGSLRYGYGTRLDRSGIGRYGVGLPKLVDVASEAGTHLVLADRCYKRSTYLALHQRSRTRYRRNSGTYSSANS